MKISATIDRFEGDLAVLYLEGKRYATLLSREILPPECREGDILSISIEIDKKRTQKTLNEISDLIDELSDGFSKDGNR